MPTNHYQPSPPLRLIHAFLFTLLISPLWAAEPPYIVIGDQKLFLAYAPKDSEVQLREYLPKGETLKHWNRMASVRVFKDLDDPRAYLSGVAENVEKSHPAARHQVLEKAETGTVILDFLMYDSEASPARFAEWNLMRAEYVKGKGLVVYQYAMRLYKIDDEAAEAINTERRRMVPPFGAATFKEVSPTGARPAN